jgi:diguanylate cyclase (GGDEF)-like protein/PAS domain S-box-containing protein
VLAVDFRLTLHDQLDVLSVSDRVESLLGYKADDFLASPSLLQQLIHPSDLSLVLSICSSASSTPIEDGRVRIRGIDGRMRSLGFQAERETSQSQLILSLALSAPTPGSGELIASAASVDLLAVLDGIGQCACIKDRQHVIRHSNRSFQTLCAGELYEVTGHTDYELFAEDYADQSYEAEEKIFAGSSIVHFERASGEGEQRPRSFESCVFPVRDEQGTIVASCTVVIDTTAQVWARQALQLSEESVKEAHRIAGLGSFLVDVPAQTWTASEVLYEILGLARDCPRTIAVWSDLILPEDLASLGRLYGEMVMGSCKILDSEIRFVRQTDKVRRWARVRGQLERDAQGRPSQLRGTLEDITERTHADAQVRASANLLQLFIHDAPTGLAMFDREMRYMSASRRWVEDRGLAEWDIVGKCLYDMRTDVSDTWRADHRRALAGETIPFKVDSFKDDRGATRWVSRMVRPWWNSGGEIGGIVVLSEDITATKEAERALRASEQSLKEAQQIAGVGSYALDIPAALWESSEALDHIFGIDARDDHTVEGWKSLIHPDDREMMSNYLASEVLGKKTSFAKQYRIVRLSDGVVRWVQGFGRIEVDAQGGLLSLRGTIQDITERKDAEGSLKESRQLLQLFIEHAPVAIAMFDRDMRYLAISRRWIENYDLEGQQILGRSHYEIFPELPEDWKKVHRTGLSGEGVRMDEELFVRASGKKRWVRWELIPWKKIDGAVGGIVMFTEDITAIKQNAERLQLAASVFTHTSESILITDADGTILDVNEAFTRITGYSRDEALGRNPRFLNSGRQGREFYAEMWAQLRETGRWSGEIWNRGKNGQIFPGMLTVSAVPDATGRTKQYVGLFSDLSPIKERERQLKHVAHFDVLTGLPNRTLLADRLRQAMAQARRLGHMLAIAYLDLDDFSAVNERHGRAAGDQFLKAITQRMNGFVGQADTLARLGGDEFAVVLLGVANTDESLNLIGRLCAAVAEPIEVGNLMLCVTASVGVALFPQADDVEPDQLVRQADQAMYFAKLAGKGRFHVFDPMLDRTMRGRHEDLQRIRQALHKQEFELHFQPKVNMRTGTILGVEALIRWRHPELGLLSPEHFLPVMEGNLLVIELGEWVIDSALKRIEEWQAQGLDMPVSVNVDALQLQEPRFVERLKMLLAQHPQIPPSRLELEVLESSAFHDIAQVSDVIRSCSQLGVTFALDDFGTGYSSLSYLKRLPVDVLKIDQSFVHDMLDDPEDLAILEGVLVLATAFRRQAIAEGVETVEHGLMLLRLGCEIGQGYQIARPMPGSDLLGWAAAWRPDPRWVNAAPIDPAQWPILHAGVEHRAWAAELEEHVQGRRTAAPPMDEHGCHLGSWLDAERAAGRGEHVDLQAIASVHAQLHAHANGILDRKDGRAEGDAATGLVELHTLKDHLIDAIHHSLHLQ